MFEANWVSFWICACPVTRAAASTQVLDHENSKPEMCFFVEDSHVTHVAGRERVLAIIYGQMTEVEALAWRLAGWLSAARIVRKQRKPCFLCHSMSVAPEFSPKDVLLSPNSHDSICISPGCDSLGPTQPRASVRH
jgi:hypothetical protein